MQAIGRVHARIRAIDDHAAGARTDRFGDQLAEQARRPIDPDGVLQIGELRIGDLHRHAGDIERAARFEFDHGQRGALRGNRAGARWRGRGRRQRQQAVGRFAAEAEAATEQQDRGQGGKCDGACHALAPYGL